MKITLTLLSITSLLILSGERASAETWAYTDPNSPDQAWTGNLGLDFTVNQAIVVTGLGVFNPNGSQVVNAGPISVAIYDSNGNQVTPIAQFTNTGGLYALNPGGFDITQSIIATVLGPGNYSVVAVGFSAADPNGNVNLGSLGPATDDGGGLLTFTGVGRYDSNLSLDYPATCVGCVVPTQFDAGTFEFTATPEPGTFGMFGLGSALAFAIVRRGRKNRLAASA